jgi:hypothetical protein
MGSPYLDAAALNPDGVGWVRMYGLLGVHPSVIDYGEFLAAEIDSSFNLIEVGRGTVLSSNWQQRGSFEAALPVLGAVSLRVALQFERVHSTETFRLHSGIMFYENLRQVDVLAPGLGLSLYPAAVFQGKYLIRGSSNPNGWALWPSLDLDLRWRRTRQYWTEGDGAESFEWVEGNEHSLQARVTWPLLPWVTAWASFERPWGWAQSSADGSTKPGSVGAHFNGRRPPDLAAEDQAVGLRFFMTPGHQGPAWSAHLGPQGQWRLDAAFRRRLSEGSQGMRVLTRSWDLSATRAMARGWQLGLGYQALVDDSFTFFWPDTVSRPLAHSISFNLGWAWGVTLAEPSADPVDAIRD